MSATPRPECAEVLRSMDAFLDGELTPEESLRVQAHLDRCPPCGERSRLERDFSQALRRRLTCERAPESLARRVLQTLDHESSRARAAGRRRGWRLALAASGYALAALFLGLWVAGGSAGLRLPGNETPGIAGAREGSEAPAAGSAAAGAPLLAVPVHLRGVIVCAVCDRLGAPMQQQPLCAAYGHFNGVREDNGRLWQVVREEGPAAVLGDSRLRGRAVAVDGEGIEKLSYLLARNVELL